MREGRVIALAGVMQALGLVRSIGATRKLRHATMMRSPVSPVRCASTQIVPKPYYGGLANLAARSRNDQSGTVRRESETRHGADADGRCRCCVWNDRGFAAFVGPRTRLRSPDSKKWRRLLEQIGVRQCRCLSARLARLYSDNISPLRPRIMVEGNSNFLQQPTQVNQIRALCCWPRSVRRRACGANSEVARWRMLFRQREYAMLARGLVLGLHARSDLIDRFDLTSLELQCAIIMRLIDPSIAHPAIWSLS